MILYIGLMYNKIYNFKEYKTTKQNNINSNNPGFADINFITLKFEDINKNDLLTQMKSIVKNTYFYFGGCQGVNIDFYKY